MRGLNIVATVLVAVVGHVEWVTFARVAKLPRSGEIVHALDCWEAAGGGGGVSARALARLNGSVHLFTAFGDDALGRRAHEDLSAAGVTVHAVFRPTQTRRAFTHVEDDGERSITVIGERLGPRGRDPLPWDLLEAADAVYLTAGDADAVQRARRARVLVATSRDLPPLAEAAVRLDALVGSATDPSEVYCDGDLAPPPDLVVRTEGERGGRYRIRGGGERRYEAVQAVAGDGTRYGAGDSFAAGLAYALGRGDAPEVALLEAARCGARATELR